MLPTMHNLTVVDHPLLRHKLGYLRDKETSSAEFRRLMEEISVSLTHEAMRDWTDMTTVAIETPIAKAKAQRIENPPILVSILRAGNGMLEGALSILPFASTGFIGIYRDKVTLEPIEYYSKLPGDIVGRTILLCDPLIATAATSLAAIEKLKAQGARNIKVLSVLISERAAKKIADLHPDVRVFTLNVETEMNDHGYLVPGLGDAGDRLYRTK